MKNRAFLLLSLFALLPVSMLRAQKLTEAVQVTAVEVPVTVVDRDGNPVRGLDRSNFELLDEGQPVSISYFDSVDFQSRSGAAPEAIPASVRRNFLLLFDLSHSSVGTIGRAQTAAKQFVDRLLEDSDLAAVGTFSVDQGFRLLTSFTADQALLDSAIETLGHPKYFRQADPLFMSAALAQSEGGGATMKAEAQAAVQEQIEDYNRSNARRNDDYLRERLKAQFQNFAAIARALDNVRGRKQIILLTEGFDARLVQGRQELGGSSQADNEAVMSGEVWKVDNDERFGNVSSASDLTEMAESFKRSDVVLHAVDIKGLRSDVDAREGFSKASTDALFLITDPTGGTVFKNQNDLEKNFGEMLHQQEVVYVLGFQASTSGVGGTFHPLTVKLKGGPRGARLSYREGYYEPSAGSDLQKVLTVSEIMQSDIAYSDLPFGVATAGFPTAEGTPQVPVVLEIDGSKLAEGVSGKLATGELYIYAFDSHDTVRDYIYQRVSFDLEKVRSALESKGIRYYGTLSLPPGKYALKTVLRINESGYIGFHRDELTVQDFAKPAVLRPFMIADTTDWIMLKAPASSAQNAAYPFEVGGQSFVPGADSTLQPNQTYKVCLFTYHLKPEDLALGAVVKNAGGTSLPAKVSLLGRSPVGDDGAMKLLFEFSTENLTPGAWGLEFTVKPKQGRTWTVDMPFRIR